MSEFPSASSGDATGKPSAGGRHGRHKSKVVRTLLRVYICKEAQDIINLEHRGKGTGDSAGQALERKLGVFNPKEGKPEDQPASSDVAPSAKSKRRVSES